MSFRPGCWVQGSLTRFENLLEQHENLLLLRNAINIPSQRKPIIYYKETPSVTIDPSSCSFFETPQQQPRNLLYDAQSRDRLVKLVPHVNELQVATCVPNVHPVVFALGGSWAYGPWALVRDRYCWNFICDVQVDVIYATYFLAPILRSSLKERSGASYSDGHAQCHSAASAIAREASGTSRLEHRCRLSLLVVNRV